MAELLGDEEFEFGADPSRLYSAALASRAVLEDARRTVATCLGVPARSVVFTSGGTESNITAVRFGQGRGPHSVITAVEHSSIQDAAREGPFTELPVSSQGLADPTALQAVLRSDTGMVHCQWVNHETGVAQPVAEFAAEARRLGVLCHVDAAQAMGNLAVRLDDLEADLVSFSAHKFGGPVGVGVIVVRPGLRLRPWMLGGAQERARRGGMENLLGILGLAAALGEAAADRPERMDRYRRLRQRVLDWAGAADGVDIVGSDTSVSPHIVCMTIAGVEPQGVLVGLDQVGVSVHSGSACAAEDLEPSPVLAAMGLDAQRSLRVSFGWTSVDADVDRLLGGLDTVIPRLRSLGS
jgi:cysteine desulfurase